jgi:hypothetical protein
MVRTSWHQFIRWNEAPDPGTPAWSFVKIRDYRIMSGGSKAKDTPKLNSNRGKKKGGPAGSVDAVSILRNSPPGGYSLIACRS